MHAGLKGEPHVDKMFQNGANIPDDPFNKGNSKGRITFATSGPNTRSTQVFVNLADNHFLDDQGFTPFGELASEADMEVFKHKINAEYGEKADQVCFLCRLPSNRLLLPSLLFHRIRLLSLHCPPLAPIGAWERLLSL